MVVRLEATTQHLDKCHLLLVVVAAVAHPTTTVVTVVRFLWLHLSSDLLVEMLLAHQVVVGVAVVEQPLSVQMLSQLQAVLVALDTMYQRLLLVQRFTRLAAVVVAVLLVVLAVRLLAGLVGAMPLAHRHQPILLAVVAVLDTAQPVMVVLAVLGLSMSGTRYDRSILCTT